MRESLHIVWAIFARDVKRLARNPIALIVVIGICLLPSMYAWYCIEANWDPYGMTSSIAVAVANEDEGADSEYAGHVDVGADIVEKLHDNHQLGWRFVDADEAKQGVESGAYYAAIIIPSNFSQDFTSVFTGHFERPQLEYYVNEKLSSVAPKVTGQGASTLEKTIDEQFVSTVSETVIEMMQKVGSEAEHEADASEGALAADVANANAAINDTRALIGGTKPALSAFKEAVVNASSALSTLQNKTPGLLEDVSAAQTQIGTMRELVRTYSAKAAQGMTDGAVALGAASSIAASAMAKAAGVVTQARSETAAAAGDASRAIAAANDLIDRLEPYAAGNAELQQALSSLRQQNQSLAQTSESLNTLVNDLADTVDAAATASSSINETVRTDVGDLREASSNVQSQIVPAATGALDEMSAALGSLAGALRALDPSVSQARDMLCALPPLLESADASLSAVDGILAATQSSLEGALSDVRSLQSSATAGELADFLAVSPDRIGEFMAAPVELKTVTVYPVANYGSGVAPFYSNLALWVSGFILMAVVRMRVDPEGLPAFTSRQAYFGRWLFYMFVGLVQGLVICLGDLLIGIQCVNPVAFVGAGLLAEFVYVNLMFALAKAFRHIGKAIAVLLLIMQIPGSSGMFPVEMMPAFYQVIHPLLPFTYSIDAMREAIGGFYGWHYLTDMLLLAGLFIPVGFAIGLGIGSAAFNLNALFDKNLGRTDLFVAEDTAQGAHKDTFRLRPVIEALMATKAYRERLTSRAERFKDAYPRMVRIGWVALFALPVALFVLMSALHAGVDAKLMMLCVFVAGVMAVDAYLIVLSYMNANITTKLALVSEGEEDASAEAGGASDA